MIKVCANVVIFFHLIFFKFINFFHEGIKRKIRKFTNGAKRAGTPQSLIAKTASP
jgi:hypothetical protein